MRSYGEFWEVLNGSESQEGVFKRDDVRGIWGQQLDGEMGYHLGRAFAELLREKAAACSTVRVVVGRDMRLGSPEFAENLVRGLEAMGVEVENLGMCGSEMIYFVTGENADEFAGGAMVTASHNPKEYAGVKFVKSGAQPLSSDELEALKKKTAASYGRMLQALLKSPGRDSRSEQFAEKLCAVAGIKKEEPNEVPLTIVLEAGNGMGGVVAVPVAELVERRLPGTKFVFVDDQPDGNFPFGAPNPLLPEYQQLLIERVKHEKADLGICFDGDADRAGFVDNDGQLLDASLISLILFKELRVLCPDRKYVLGNLNSSLRFINFVKNEPQYEFVMTPVGHAKIKELMRTSPFMEEGRSRVLFASEHSGHYFYPDFFSADSGMTTSLLVIANARKLKAQGKSLAEAMKPRREGFYSSGELNAELDSDAKAPVKIGAVAADPKFQGGVFRGVKEVGGCHQVVPLEKNAYVPDELAALDLRVDSPDGEEPAWWFSLRKSGNEPVLRLNVEAQAQTDKKMEAEKKMEELRDQLLAIIRE